MPKLSYSEKALTAVPVQFCRIILTEQKSSWHRLVTQADGSYEYQQGVGKFTELTPRAWQTLVRSVIQAAKAHQLERIAIDVNPENFPLLKQKGSAWLAQSLIENILLASYEFGRYKTKVEPVGGLKEILVCGSLVGTDKAALKKGECIAGYSNKARDIANTTGADLTPKKLGEAAQSLAKGLPIKVTIHQSAAIKKLKLGLLEAVGKGANDGPVLIVMEYQGGKAGSAPLVLIGKGVTYDTGGLNVKPSGAMHDMHLDMSGGSSVMAAVCAAATLKIKKNIIVIVPAAENAVSDRAMRAGDIATSHAGLTVEILHTDAEGRLILADALSYCAQYKPKVIVDVATLTGAALVALGQHSSALMTKNDELGALLTSIGEETGEYVWPLPLWDEYKQYLKSYRADISNISTSFAKWGGCIEGGTFLSCFAPKKTPWAHIDIAPRMESVPSDKLAKGSTGEPVRLLVAFLEQY